MAGGINKVLVLGRLGQDPEVKTFNDGGQITNITLATDDQWKDKNGDQQKRTEWHRITFRGSLAGVAEKYLRKGDQCHVEGKLQTRSWEKDGQKHYTTEIIAFNLTLLGGGNGEGGRRSNGGSGGSQSPAQAGPSDEFEDDVPF
ncbi:MAG: single-stranded DNA-binding protein [Candidatus Dadabacteria bacterium]|nr:single-stranded DNA-binding protein [Candidatus Dadabacteria bacterium]